jgi:hypothetical protein
VAWAAGFIDGEGCIAIVRRQRVGEHAYYSLQISVSQRDKAPLLFLQHLFGGQIIQTRPSRGLPQWKYALHTRAAYQALVELRPRLLLKRAQADVAMRFQEAKARINWRMTEAQKRAQVLAYEEISRLKKTDCEISYTNWAEKGPYEKELMAA